jgi:hypothetical protein
MYCTPLSLGYPLAAENGQVFKQKVVIRPGLPEASRRAGRREQSQTLHLTLSETTRQPLPRLGLSMASHGRELGGKEIELLSELALSQKMNSGSAWPATSAAVAARQVGNPSFIAFAGDSRVEA